MLRKARRTVYAITNQRAIVFDAGVWRGMTIQSFGPDRLNDLRRVQHSDGTGDLIFQRVWRSDGDGGSRSMSVGFLAIAEVKRIEDLIRTHVVQPAS